MSALHGSAAVILLVYQAWMLSVMYGARANSAVAHGAKLQLVTLLILATACALARQSRRLASRAREVSYRVVLFGAVIANYLVLGPLLPLLRPQHVDAALLRADLQLFGFEPAFWLERFNSRPAVEWFAFFYLSYFGICSAFGALLILWRDARAEASELATGTVLLFCVGQLGYLAVPALGPVHAFADHFQGSLQGGPFWGVVRSMVEAAGGLGDVFPSMHTAAPVWFALFALRRWHTNRAWRIARVTTAFFALQIVISTMFLRWHYGVDVAAGLALAILTAWVAPRLVWRERYAPLSMPAVGLKTQL